MNDIAFITALVSVAVILVWIFWRFMYKPYYTRKERVRAAALSNAARRPAGGISPKTCPVCGESIDSVSRIKSKIFGTEGRGERLMHLYGCPQCWPDNTAHRRVCPVCEKVVPRGGYLIARYYEKQERNHVHVLGCSGCRRG